MAEKDVKKLYKLLEQFGKELTSVEGTVAGIYINSILATIAKWLQWYCNDVLHIDLKRGSL